MLNKMWNTKGAIALAIAAVVLPACTNQVETNTPTSPTGVTETTQPQANTSTTPLGNVTTQEVANKTAQLIGKTVTIRSKPIKKIGDNTFTVSDQQFFGNETILVVNASGQPIVLNTNNSIEVQVTGQVAKLVLADINRRYGALGLDPNLYVDYEGKPAIIAQSIAPAPEPGQLTSNPSRYYGKPVAVTGEVGKILSPTTFTLNDEQLFGGNDLLVLVANRKSANKPANTTAVKTNETLAVTGVLRPFVVADLERDYDLTWNLNLQKQLEAEYKTKPVLVVDAIYPSAIPQALK